MLLLRLRCGLPPRIRTAGPCRRGTATQPPALLPPPPAAEVPLLAVSKAHPVYFLHLPITTRELLVYCVHSPAHAIDDSLATVRLQRRAVALGTKGWAKLSLSRWRINQAIVRWVGKLLERVLYRETALRSIPPMAMLRRVVEPAESSAEKAVVSGSVTTLATSADLATIPLYHPVFESARSVRSSIVQEAAERAAFHRTRVWYCLLGMPLVAPFALVPVVPNVPFFWLAYRAYCHFEAHQGAKHLDYLVGKDPASLHLELVGYDALDQAYGHHGLGIEEVAFGEGATTDELLVMTEHTAQRLAAALGCPELEKVLVSAVRRNKQRLAA